MKLSRPAGTIAGLALIFVWVAADQWLFTRVLGTSYPAWYLANGSLIGLITSVVSLAWGDLNRHLGLISAHPLDYLGSWFQLAGLPLYEIGTHLRTDAPPRGSRSGIDLVITGLIAGLISVAILAWIVVVVPVQYFIYLVCGAPGRVLARSGRRVEARFERGGQLEVREVERSAPPSDGWWEAGIASKPVALTGIVVSLAFVVTELVM